MKTFFTRTATAAVFVFVLLLSLNYNYYTFSAFFILIGLIGMNEFFRLMEKLHTRPHKIIGYLAYLALVLFPFLVKGDFNNLFPCYEVSRIILCLSLILIFSLFIAELLRKDPSLKNVAYTLMSFFYVAFPVMMLIYLGFGMHDFTPYKVIGIILFTWINDTGAYLTGSFIGKHKLYEKISPNKTWEGSFGGIVLCVGLSFVVGMIYPELAQVHWTIISFIVAVFGTFGDLSKSLLKRMAGVKDTGTLMPGHGGVLDRFDSLFFSAPFVFSYYALTGNL